MKSSKRKRELAICGAAVTILWVLVFAVSCYVEQMNIEIPAQDNNQTQE